MIKIFEWEVVPATCTLRKIETDEESHLSPRGMEVLAYLHENRGKVVSAHELLEKFWSRSVVSDHAVHNAIAEIRAALGDSASKPRYIRTFPKRGYSLLADTADPRTGPAEKTLGVVLNSWVAAAIANPSSFGVGATCLLIGAIIGFSATAPDPGNVESAIHPGSTTLVVVPFEKINIAEENRYWVQQFADQFPSFIAKIPDIEVRKAAQTASSADFINQNPQLADYVLSGSVVQANDQVRLSLELISAIDGTVRFFDKFDLGSEALFSVQDNVSSHVVTALGIYFNDEQRKAMTEWGTDSVTAYTHFLKAEFHAMQANDLDFDLAIENYSHALDDDPNFLNAHIGLANTAARKALYSHNATTARMARIVNSELRELIRLQADEESMLAIEILALRVEGTNQKLIEQRLRELILAGNAPSFAYAHYAVYLTSARMYDEAQQFLRIGRKESTFIISPDSIWNYPSRVETPLNLVSIKKRQLLKRPSHESLISSLVRSAAFTGDFPLANKYLDRQLELDPDGAFTMLNQIIISALAGSSTEAGDRLERENSGNPDYNFSYGSKCFILGDLDCGIELWQDLNAAETRRLYNFIDSIEIFFPPTIALDTRYLQLLEEMGVGISWQRTLMDGITEMSGVTGVNLNGLSQAAYDANIFMSRNNLWDHESVAYPSTASASLELSSN